MERTKRKTWNIHLIIFLHTISRILKMFHQIACIAAQIENDRKLSIQKILHNGPMKVWERKQTTKTKFPVRTSMLSINRLAISSRRYSKSFESGSQAALSFCNRFTFLSKIFIVQNERWPATLGLLPSSDRALGSISQTWLHEWCVCVEEEKRNSSVAQWRKEKDNKKKENAASPSIEGLAECTAAPEESVYSSLWGGRNPEICTNSVSLIEHATYFSSFWFVFFFVQQMWDAWCSGI